MNNDLMPIGTEFEMIGEPDKTCSRPRWRVFRYRVVAHDKVRDGMAERIEPIDILEFPVTEWLQLGSLLLPIPPPELRGRIPGWSRLGIS